MSTVVKWSFVDPRIRKKRKSHAKGQSGSGKSFYCRHSCCTASKTPFASNHNRKRHESTVSLHPKCSTQCQKELLANFGLEKLSHVGETDSSIIPKILKEEIDSMNAIPIPIPTPSSPSSSTSSDSECSSASSPTSHD
jgi:hypothetical protein